MELKDSEHTKKAKKVDEALRRPLGVAGKLLSLGGIVAFLQCWWHFDCYWITELLVVFTSASFWGW